MIFSFWKSTPWRSRNFVRFFISVLWKESTCWLWRNLKIVLLYKLAQVNYSKPMVKTSLMHLPLSETGAMLAWVQWVPCNPYILRKRFSNPLIFEKELKELQWFQNSNSFHWLFNWQKNFGTHWLKTLTESLLGNGASIS